MSYGTWGFIGGAAKAGEKFGEAMMKDEFEKRREERLQRAKDEMEASRRKWEAKEHDRRLKVNFKAKHGEGADFSRGSVHYENKNEVAQFERMTEPHASRAELTAEAQGRGQEDRDARLHRQRLAEQAARDAAALERKQSEAGGGAGIPANVMTNLRADFADRYRIDADTAMALWKQDEEEHGTGRGSPRPRFNEYMSKGVGKPNLIEFAAKEYCVDITTGSRIPDCTPSLYRAPEEERSGGSEPNPVSPSAFPPAESAVEPQASGQPGLLSSFRTPMQMLTDGPGSLARGARGAIGDAIFGPPGLGPGQTPYREGQRLRGPDGRIYVVRDGVPVPEE